MVISLYVGSILEDIKKSWLRTGNSIVCLPWEMGEISWDFGCKVVDIGELNGMVFLHGICLTNLRNYDSWVCLKMGQMGYTGMPIKSTIGVGKLFRKLKGG